MLAKQPFLVYLNRLFGNQEHVIAHSLPWTTFRLKWFLFDTKLNIYAGDRWPALHYVSMSEICCRYHYYRCMCKEEILVTFSRIVQTKVKMCLMAEPIKMRCKDVFFTCFRVSLMHSVWGWKYE